MLELDNFEEDIYPQEPTLQIETETKPTFKLRSLVPFNSNLPKEEINKIENSSTKTATISSVTFMNAANLLNKQPDDSKNKLTLPIGERKNFFFFNNFKNKIKKVDFSSIFKLKIRFLLFLS